LESTGCKNSDTIEETALHDALKKAMNRVLEQQSIIEE
jgi:hypothetical protein